jgi:hypothetical protein
MVHYREAIDRPRLALHDYTKPLTSNSFDFITCLSITIQFPVPDLVKLAKMANLGILEIVNLEEKDSVEVDGSCNVGDSLIRAWSREARENHAFPVLRILRLWNHSNVTQASIRYIHDFPALGIFDIQSCGIDDGLLAAEAVVEAVRLGWTDALDVEISNAVEQECLLASKSHGSGAKSPKGLLWPGSRISRVERSVTPESSTEAMASTSFQNSAYTISSPGTSRADGSFALKDSPDKSVGGDDEWVSMDHRLFCEVSERTTWIRDAWECQNSMCWALLGDVRQDSDLVKAGVKDVTKAARAGDHLVSPVPIAHIRLGKRSIHDAISLLRWSNGNLRGFRRGLALIRLAMPTPTQLVVKPQQGGKRKEKMSAKKSIRRVRESRKRKLEGLLEDFNN